MTQNTESPISALIGSVRRLASLYIDNAKFTVAEKATVLMSAVTIAFLSMLLSLAAMLFIVVGIANWLETYIEPFWTYFIVAGILMLLIFILICFRVKLIYNPIARFVSKLFIDPPAESPKK